MKIIDLKKEKYFIKQYVNLRNSYAELLLTSPVNLYQTKEWLKRNDIEIKGIVEDRNLLGVGILYLRRDAEVAVFVKKQKEGIGSQLLHIIEEIAKKKNLKFIWAWVLKDNFIAQGVFKKNGFVTERINKRKYRGAIKEGIKYKKFLDC